MIFIDLDVDETFFTIATFPRKNRMSNSLSSLLVFIATMCPTFTSINGSNGNASSSFLFVGMMCSVVVDCCFLASLDVVFCGFSHRGPKYPLSNIGGR